jgi:hypothetical protein
MVNKRIYTRFACLMFLMFMVCYSSYAKGVHFASDVETAYSKNFPKAKETKARAERLTNRLDHDHNTGGLDFLFVGHKTSDGNFAKAGTPNVEMNYCEWYGQDGAWRHPAGGVPKIGERYGAWYRYQYSKSKKEWRGAMMCAGGWNADHRKGTDTGDD